MWTYVATAAAAAPGRHGSVIRIGRWLVPIALLVYLGHRLTELGWSQIGGALPAQPLYYVLIGLAFLVQPVADRIIYRNLWRSGKPPGLQVLLRKRFLNSMMLDYSGEAYLFAWAVRHARLPSATLAHSIAHSNILSAGAGLIIVWLMLLGLGLAGGVELPFPASTYTWLAVALTSLPFPLCMLLILFRRRLTTLPSRQILVTFALHFGRGLCGQALQFALWSLSGALASSAACLQFVVIQLLVSRLPLMPNKDLIFVGTALAAAGAMELNAAPIAGVLLTLTAGDFLLNLVLTGLPWLISAIRIGPIVRLRGKGLTERAASAR
jgi:hypothetical protein